jgi:hypothetical protein
LRTADNRVDVMIDWPRAVINVRFKVQKDGQPNRCS